MRKLDSRRFIDRLRYHPSPNNIARALVTEYLMTSGASCARSVRLSPDDSLTFIGEYGHSRSFEGQGLPSSQWRTWHKDHADMGFVLAPDNWNEEAITCLFSLHDRGVVHVEKYVENAQVKASKSPRGTFQ